jgi:2-polyprenyl-3-methyl-5-hydroxy-6-metoxy-1,4-benzoquinol methylase
MSDKPLMESPVPSSGSPSGSFDTSSHDRFYEYYAAESATPATERRFRVLRDHLLAAYDRPAGTKLDMLDIGCGAGTFSILWAELGHRVTGIDINEPLIDLARKRAREAGHDIAFKVASATELPFPDRSFDVVCSPELLEHVQNWTQCIAELTRVLRPGGMLYLSTTNRLCPKQQEFNLPLYSWYPPVLQRRYVRLAMTTRPELANYAKYPAFNWFTFFGLRRYLRGRGFTRCFDRFDLAGRSAGLKGMVFSAIRGIPGLRIVAQVACPGTIIAAIKD